MSRDDMIYMIEAKIIPPMSECTELALSTFEQELREFSFDGLTTLRADLITGEVPVGTWKSCPLSYRNGSAGSAHRDTLGYACNSFTRLWDIEVLTIESLVALIDDELTRRLADGVGAAKCAAPALVVP